MYSHQSSRAQGTIEYLVIIAIVIVIALVVVALFSGEVGTETQSISVNSENLGASTGNSTSGIIVVESAVDSSGNGLVKVGNFSGGQISLASISAISSSGTSADNNYESAYIASGGSSLFSLSDLQNACACGATDTKKSCVFNVRYMTENGIVRNQKITANVSCVSTAVPTAKAITPIGIGYTLIGPTDAYLNEVTTYSVAPTKEYTGTITITPSGVASEGIPPQDLTFNHRLTPRTFTLQPTTLGSLTLTPTSSGAQHITDPAPLVVTVHPITYTFTGPASLPVQTTSGEFTVTPSRPYYGPIFITATGTASVSVPEYVYFYGDNNPQTFTVTPTTAGDATITASNNGGLIDPAPLSYTIDAVLPSAPTNLVATTGDTKATVSFDAPALDGGTPITGYTVISSPAGGVDLNAGQPDVSPHVISGLTNGTNYTFTAIATNAAGTSPSSSVSNQITPIHIPNYAWMERTSAGARSWKGIASSSDGNKLVAVPYGGYIYTSTDSGATWTQDTNSGTRGWWRVSSSSNGMKLVAVDYNAGYVATSINGGALWTTTGYGNKSWNSVASSADGNKLIAGMYNWYPYLSTNSGTTFSLIFPLGVGFWKGVASSSDGNKLAAVNFSGTVYTSIDSGATWTPRSIPGSQMLYSIASSADGNIILATDNIPYVYISKNSGVSFTRVTDPLFNYPIFRGGSAAISSDGTHLAVAAYSGYIITSVDGGTTWISQNDAGQRNWFGSAFSADGNKLAAVEDGGYIYTGVWN